MLIVRLNIQTKYLKIWKTGPPLKIRLHSQHRCPVQDSISRPHLEKRLRSYSAGRKTKPDEKKTFFVFFVFLPKGHKPTLPRTGNK